MHDSVKTWSERVAGKDVVTTESIFKFKIIAATKDDICGAPGGTFQNAR